MAVKMERERDLVYAHCELEFCVLILQTQFMSVITGTVLYPHLYEDGIENRVVALTKVVPLLISMK